VSPSFRSDLRGGTASYARPYVPGISNAYFLGRCFRASNQAIAQAQALNALCVVIWNCSNSWRTNNCIRCSLMNRLNQATTRFTTKLSGMPGVADSSIIIQCSLRLIPLCSLLMRHSLFRRENCIEAIIPASHGLIAVLQPMELAKGNGLASYMQTRTTSELPVAGAQLTGDRSNFLSIRCFPPGKSDCRPCVSHVSKRWHWMQCSRQENIKFAVIIAHKEALDVMCS
jgi:hypothetical protein